MHPQKRLKICFHPLKKHQSNKLIVGDFNFPGTNWNSFEGKNLCEELFINLTHDCVLTQHVNEPTRLDSSVVNRYPNFRISIVQIDIWM